MSSPPLPKQRRGPIRRVMMPFNTQRDADTHHIGEASGRKHRRISVWRVSRWILSGMVVVYFTRFAGYLDSGIRHSRHRQVLEDVLPLPISNQNSSILHSIEVSRWGAASSSKQAKGVQTMGPGLSPTGTSRITFTLSRDFAFNNTYGFNTECPVGTRTEKGKKVTVQANSPDLQHLLELTTTITTDLKILVLGDSVAIQFCESLDEAVGATSENRQIFRYAWGSHEGLSVSAPVRGGGVMAGWRVTGLWLPGGEGKPLPNSPGGGWTREDVHVLLNHSFVDQDGNSQTVTSFDAMVYRLPHGWLQLGEITRDNLLESLALAHTIFGVSTVILSTLHFQNNVKTEQDLSDLARVNEMIREVALNWNPSDSGIRTVLLLEFGRWTNGLIEANAEKIGMNTSSASYPLSRLGCKRYAPSIAQICAVSAKENDCRYCTFNRISRDGMHFCMESISGRLNAAVACLLGCAYNEGISSPTSLRSCQNDCNARFMSMRPVDTGPDSRESVALSSIG